MVPLAVDPEALFAAGSAVVAAGDGLAANLTVLTAGFAANTGLDAAGTVFGLQYQSAAESLLQAAAAAINACRYNGAKIQLSASNYSRAEVASTLGGGGSVLPPPGEPVKIAPPGPPGTLGPGEPPPPLWAVVQSFVDDVWPDGDVAALYAAASRWRSFGAALSGMQGALSASKSLVGEQQIAEGERVNEVLSQIGDHVNSIGAQCGKLAGTLDDFANQVSHAQNAIRDLLHRLGSLADLGHDVVLIFEGKALDEIEQIAQDINAVLHNLGREARAFEQGMQLGMQVIDGLVVDMEKHMRGEFTHFLGEAVGNQVATVFDTWVNANEGAFKGFVGMVQGIEDLDPRWFLIDPKGAAATWMGMTKTGLLNHVLNPQEAVEADKQMFRSLLHLDDWRSDRPGLGFGENAFDVATLFLPGVGEVGAGAKGAGAAARSAEAADAAGTAGRAAEFGDLAAASGELGDIGATSTALTKDLDGLTGDLPKTEPPVSGSPMALPAEKLPEVPGEPAAHPVESAAPRPHEPVPAPADGVHEPASAPAGGVHDPVAAPAAPYERLPSINPQTAEQVPVSPSGSPASPAPAAAHSPQPAPAAAPRPPAPYFASHGGRPAELPAPHGGRLHGPDDGGPPDIHPHGRPPHGGGPHGPGGSKPSSHPPGDGLPSRHGNTTGDDGTTVETPEGTEGASPPPARIPGIDYSLPAADASRVLEHPGAELARLVDGGVPHNIFEGYEPLAGRTAEAFKREFTIQGLSGETWWDWDAQAPRNGFARNPLESNLIPPDLRLDRLGSNGGGFLSPEGTPLAERATPPGLATQYHVFEGTGREIPSGKEWVVQHGPAKDAFGQPGGGDQWIVLDKTTGWPVPVEELIQARLLKEITPPK